MALQGLNRAALARKVNIDPKTLRKIFKSGGLLNNHQASIPTLIAKRLEIEIADLLVDTDEIPNPNISIYRQQLERVHAEASAGHVETAMEQAFRNPHIAQFRSELIQLEAELSTAQIQDVVGVGGVHQRARERFCDWTKQTVSKLLLLDDLSISRGYSRVCADNLPNVKTLALKSQVVTDCLDVLGEKSASVVVFSGKHGKGKSSIALQSARSAVHLARYDIVLWVDLRYEPSWRQLLGAYQRMYPGFTPRSTSGAKQVAQLMSYIESTGERLLVVLDNWDDLRCEHLKLFVSKSAGVDIIITTILRDCARQAGIKSHRLFEPNLDWLLEEFLVLVAWHASRRDRLKPLERGAQIAYNLLTSGQERFLQSYEPHPEYSTEERHLATNTVELCSDVFHYNPKMLTSVLPHIEKVSMIRKLDRVPSESFQEMLRVSELRWQLLTRSARTIADLLTLEREGMSEGLLRELSGLGDRVFYEALDCLDSLGFLDEPWDPSNQDPVHRLHAVEHAVIVRGLGRRREWDASLARKVISFVFAPDLVDSTKRLSAHSQLFVEAVEVLAGEFAEEAANIVIELAPALRRQGLWESGRSAALFCYRALNHDASGRLRLHLILRIIAWVAFWRSEFRECLTLLEEVEDLIENDRDRVAIELMRVQCRLNLSDHDAAQQLLSELGEFDVVQQDPALLVDFYQVRTRVEIELGSYLEAIYWANRAREVARSSLLSKASSTREQSIALYYRAKAEYLAGNAEVAWNTIWDAYRLNGQQHVPSIAYERLMMAQCERERGFKKGTDFFRACLREAHDIFRDIGDLSHMDEVKMLLASLPNEG